MAKRRKRKDEEKQELIDYLVLLKEALLRMSNGEKRQLKIAAGILRLMLSWKGKNDHPLLFRIADGLNVALKCFGPREFNDKHPLFNHITFAIHGKNIWLEADYNTTGIQRYNFKDWLYAKLLKLGEHVFSPIEIIKLQAEKEGLSHCDEDIPEEMDMIKGIIHFNEVRQLNEIERVIVETAEVTLIFGNKLLSIMDNTINPVIIQEKIKLAEIAQAKLKEKNYESLSNVLLEMLNYDENDAVVCGKLATLNHQYLNRYEDAKFFYEKALHLNPDVSELHNDYAWLLERELNDNTKAIIHYCLAIDINPNHCVAINNLHFLMEKLDKG